MELSNWLKVYALSDFQGSKRDPKAFFNDAILLPKTIMAYCIKYPLSPEQRENVNNCISEYTFNISHKLAHDGEKILAIKMLKVMKIRALFESRNGRLFNLLKHLLVPKILKDIFRKARIR
jgi:hypothetical protein